MILFLSTGGGNTLEQLLNAGKQPGSAAMLFTEPSEPTLHENRCHKPKPPGGRIVSFESEVLQRGEQPNQSFISSTKLPANLSACEQHPSSLTPIKAGEELPPCSSGDLEATAIPNDQRDCYETSNPDELGTYPSSTTTENISSKSSHRKIVTLHMMHTPHGPEVTIVNDNTTDDNNSENVELIQSPKAAPVKEQVTRYLQRNPTTRSQEGNPVQERITRNSRQSSTRSTFSLNGLNPEVQNNVVKMVHLYSKVQKYKTQRRMFVFVIVGLIILVLIVVVALVAIIAAVIFK